MTYADEIKLVLIGWLLDHLIEKEAIWTELRFSEGKNRADVLVCSPSRLCAYEIKSPRDDFRRLKTQQMAYRSAFLESYVVLTSEGLDAARRYLSPTIGIITIDDRKNVVIRRKTRPRKRLSKTESLAWLRVSEIAKLIDSPAEHREEMSRRATRLSQTFLSDQALQSIYLRIQPRFAAFLLERGENLNSDDLRMLSMPTRVAH